MASTDEDMSLPAPTQEHPTHFLAIPFNHSDIDASADPAGPPRQDRRQPKNEVSPPTRPAYGAVASGRDTVTLRQRRGAYQRANKTVQPWGTNVRLDRDSSQAKPQTGDTFSRILKHFRFVAIFFVVLAGLYFVLRHTILKRQSGLPSTIRSAISFEHDQAILYAFQARQLVDRPNFGCRDDVLLQLDVVISTITDEAEALRTSLSRNLEDLVGEIETVTDNNDRGEGLSALYAVIEDTSNILRSTYKKAVLAKDALTRIQSSVKDEKWELRKEREHRRGEYTWLKKHFFAQERGSRSERIYDQELAKAEASLDEILDSLESAADCESSFAKRTQKLLLKVEETGGKVVDGGRDAQDYASFLEADLQAMIACILDGNEEPIGRFDD